MSVNDPSKNVNDKWRSWYSLLCVSFQFSKLEEIDKSNDFQIPQIHQRYLDYGSHGYPGFDLLRVHVSILMYKHCSSKYQHRVKQFPLTYDSQCTCCGGLPIMTCWNSGYNQETVFPEFRHSSHVCRHYPGRVLDYVRI